MESTGEGAGEKQPIGREKNKFVGKTHAYGRSAGLLDYSQHVCQSNDYTSSLNHLPKGKL
jgi:hypothetical protein